VVRTRVLTSECQVQQIRWAMTGMATSLTATHDHTLVNLQLRHLGHAYFECTPMYSPPSINVTPISVNPL
jgi:hypothetical protein